MIAGPRGGMEGRLGDSGWRASAQAYIDFQDEGDPHRRLLLDPVMLEQCGAVAGRRVLDVGCGEGRWARMLATRGAAVVGLDPTERMVRTARQRGGGGQEYVRAGAERLPFAEASFHLVTSYVVLVDVPGFRPAIAEMARVLRPGGQVVVANISFLSVNAGWVRDVQGRRLHYAMDRYLEERPVALEWRGMRLINWHRPLSAYMEAFLGAGLRLRAFLEPMPRDDSLREDPRFEDWYRLPNFVVMRWEKPG